MGIALDLGVGALAALAMWVVVFALFTLILQLVMVQRWRKRLRLAGRRTGRPTLVFVLLHGLLLTGFAAYSGVMFSLQRSVAKALERGSGALVKVAVGRGLPALRQQLDLADGDQPVPVETLRAAVQARAAEVGPDPTAHGGTPSALLFGLPDMLEATWWWAANESLKVADPTVKALTWRQLDELVKPTLEKKGRAMFRKLGDRFNSAANMTLYVLLGFLAVVDGVTHWLVRRASRKPSPSG